MNVKELLEQLERINDAGLGHMMVYSAVDYGFNVVNEAEVRSHAMFKKEGMPWDESLPHKDVVVLW